MSGLQLALFEVAGHWDGRLIPLAGSGPFSLAEDANGAIVASPGAASGPHAEIAQDHGSFWLTDFAPLLKVRLNDVRVQGQVELHDGDRLSFATSTFTVLLGANLKQRHRDALRSTVLVDRLTRVANKVSFTEHLARERARSLRHHRPLALLIINLDRFMSLNHRFGFQAGDDVLRSVAQLISAESREEELVARLSGDGFGWIIPEMGPDEIDARAQALRAVIERTAFQFEDQVIKVTVSIGGARLTTDLGGRTLFEQAEENLDEAKKAGRNCVFLLAP